MHLRKAALNWSISEDADGSGGMLCSMLRLQDVSLTAASSTAAAAAAASKASASIHCPLTQLSLSLSASKCVLAHCAAVELDRRAGLVLPVPLLPLLLLLLLLFVASVCIAPLLLSLSYYYSTGKPHVLLWAACG